MACVRLQLSLPPPPLQASKLLVGPPLSPPNVCTLWMTLLNPDLSLSFHCTKNEEILNGKLHFLCNVCHFSLFTDERYT